MQVHRKSKKGLEPSAEKTCYERVEWNELPRATTELRDQSPMDRTVKVLQVLLILRIPAAGKPSQLSTKEDGRNHQATERHLELKNTL